MDYSYLQTVAENKHFYSKQEIEGAELARCLQRILWWPSTKSYKNYEAHNLVHNSPIIVDNINHAEQVYELESPLLQEKMKRRTPPFAGKYIKLPLPPQVTLNHQFCNIET